MTAPSTKPNSQENYSSCSMYEHFITSSTGLLRVSEFQSIDYTVMIMNIVIPKTIFDDPACQIMYWTGDIQSH